MGADVLGRCSKTVGTGLIDIDVTEAAVDDIVGGSAAPAASTSAAVEGSATASKGKGTWESGQIRNVGSMKDTKKPVNVIVRSAQ